ncbi:hypothetical protein DTO013E5_7646 [Penicillium roqueforti]|uniref:Rhodopsin domain-containing protein n=1 Tax=Penicillium roqueforti (strain FM164) TaxID=1365484 RepID=W6QNM8_PENRF|nr:uncharacterized protein LCP9604111_9690 [Penicillium roqueforti]CDM37566.1 unnamed protein product [Penicillium roqueforti FM164]KAF9237688.1 hypothetical protein LCP9604111_9690 [Penicillium roqueforti]KAI2695965.1 hypothetical protein CBS147372_8842 [Penicillium roqueforti]KAI2696431.1 hypothetical protein CBS147332_8998 [Penicillium roqueforti]KAI2708822.1 hypothetical protein CBS147318_9336 [Penicillium roqueforti]
MEYHRALLHVNDRTGLIVMTSIFFLTGIFAVSLRFYSRRLSKVPLGLDDWFALSSLFFVLALNGIFLSGVIQGAITGHSIVLNNWPQPSALEVLVQKYKYAFQTTEKIAFGLIKTSILLLWKRMLSPIRSFQLLCWVMIGIVAAWSISFFFATLFQCGTHWDWNWAPIGFFLTECTDTLNMLTVFCGTDVLTDFVIMLMPVPIIWKLKMSVKKKIGVTSVFMVGIFTIGAGVARTYIYLVTSYDKEDNLDFIADFTLFILWSEIEVNVAMIVCCMPVFGPVLGQCRDTLYRRFGRSKDGEFGLLGPSTSESTNDGKTRLASFSASNRSYPHYE